jgi:hypothetical protein
MAFVHTIKAEGGAINYTTPAMTSDRRLVAMTVRVNVAPTTGDVFSVILDSKHGAEYDATLYSITLSSASTANILKSDFNLPLSVGDALRVTFLNTDGRTFGIQLILE